MTMCALKVSPYPGCECFSPVLASARAANGIPAPLYMQARMLGSKPEIDFNACTITCGDGRQIDFNKDPNSFVM